MPEPAIVEDRTMEPHGLGISRFRLGLKLGLKHVLAPVGLVLRRPAGQRVLFYHRVNSHDFARLGLVSRELSVPPARFARQMNWLATHGYRTLRLEEFHRIMTGRAPADPKAVLLTFDDGYADNLEFAAPVLARHGFTAVLFPVSGLIGADNRVWPMSDPEGLGLFMDGAQLAAWLDAGNEIGSHTCSHPVLTQIDDRALATELRDSRAELSAAFGQPCDAIAYPGGDVDGRVARATLGSGYTMGFTTRSGRNPPGSDLMRLCRTEVSRSDSQLIFVLKMRGIFDWLGVRDTVAYRNFMRFSNRLFARAASKARAET